jgi:hypothetical protein
LLCAVFKAGSHEGEDAPEHLALSIWGFVVGGGQEREAEEERVERSGGGKGSSWMRRAWRAARMVVWRSWRAMLRERKGEEE